MPKRGISPFSIENLLSHSSKKHRWGTLLCFTKFLVSKNVKDKRGGGNHDFPSKFFCLTVLKHFVEEPFCAVFQKISSSEKVYGQEGGEYKDFPWKIFCLKVPKNFVREAFCVSQNFWYRKKIMDKRGV